MKVVLHILGSIIAAVLSLVLICTLLVLPIFHGTATLLQPKALEAIIDEIDLDETLMASPELTQALAENGISQEAARALLECDAVEELLQSVAGDTLKAIRGEFVQPSLTQDGLQDLVRQHREELLEVVLLLAPAEYSLTTEGANLLLDQLVTEQGGLLIDTINDAMTQLQQEMQAQNITVGFNLIAGGTMTAVLIGMAVVLAGLIYLCRLRHAQGLVWLGVDAILAALPSLAIGVALMGSQLVNLFVPDRAAAAAILPLLHHAGVSVLIGAIVLIALGALSITGFVLLRDRRLKKEAAAAQTALPEVE